jgi:hypothetical protein
MESFDLKQLESFQLQDFESPLSTSMILEYKNVQIAFRERFSLFDRLEEFATFLVSFSSPALSSIALSQSTFSSFELHHFTAH